MPSLNLTAASRAAGVGRSTIVRALKSGRLSATTNEQGERVIDVSELVRVFGQLKDTGYPREQAVDSRGIDQNGDMVTLLREQLTAALEREKQTVERGREREARLLALLESEQQSRHDLETKLLPAPRSTPVGKVRAWILLTMLAAVLVFAGWHFRTVIVSALAS
ncbi:MAG TPA: hypothetical protein PKC42_03875 [Candidatus Nanoperiomorbaceae bacterium]|nr:hypothetical protein [Candidatus Nanoperiomorbaceae bacterium]